MDNALWLYHNLDVVEINTEQPFCFHDFQSFVNECRGINRDLVPHRPVRMTERLLYRYVFELRSCFSAERTAGCSNQKFFNFFSVFPVQALENRRVLAVHRKDLHTAFLCQRHNNVSRRYQCLFVCQCNVFSCLHRRNRRADADHADDRCHKDFALRHRGKLDHAVHAAADFYRKILHSVTEFCRFHLIADCRKLRMKFPDLLLEQCNIASGADADHLKIAVGTHDIEGLGSDRTG